MRGHLSISTAMPTNRLNVDQAFVEIVLNDTDFDRIVRVRVTLAEFTQVTMGHSADLPVEVALGDKYGVKGAPS